MFAFKVVTWELILSITVAHSTHMTGETPGPLELRTIEANLKLASEAAALKLRNV